jgi:selenocysteine lyase/cysteine desulfurase
MPLACQRHLFDLPADITYLNCAYLGPLSRSVLAAGLEGLGRKARPWEVQPDDFFSTLEEARLLFARLVAGDPDGIALVPSVSYGIAVAAANLPLPPGAEILVLEEQFPSNVYAWRDLVVRRRARLRTVPRPENHDWTDAILRALGAKTAIVALPHCHWIDGGLLDLNQIGSRARDIGAALVVDGCQSVGALPIDVGQIQPDFLVTACYKWLLGPYSQAFLWVAPRWRQGRPLEHNWITRANRRDFAGLVHYTDQLAAGARRFDSGEVSNFALLPASVAAVRQTLGWGVGTIQVTLRQLTDRIADAATELDLEVGPATHRSGHLLGLRLSGQEPRALAAALAQARVFVSVRGDSIRISPHVYNDDSDIDRFLEVLTGALERS